MKWVLSKCMWREQLLPEKSGNLQVIEHRLRTQRVFKINAEVKIVFFLPGYRKSRWEGTRFQISKSDQYDANLFHVPHSVTLLGLLQSKV